MRRVWDACEGKAEETFATNLRRKAAEAAASEGGPRDLRRGGLDDDGSRPRDPRRPPARRGLAAAQGRAS